MDRLDFGSPREEGGGMKTNTIAYKLKPKELKRMTRKFAKLNKDLTEAAGILEPKEGEKV